MHQAQYIYGDDGEKHILKKSGNFKELLEDRSKSSLEQAEAKLRSWFLTPLEADTSKFASFFYCPVGLKPDNIPDMAVYGINGLHSYERPSPYLQLFMSDLVDLQGKNFFGIFSIPYLSNIEVEELAASNREIGGFELGRADLSVIDRRKAIPDESLKAILLKIFRGERVYILSDMDTNFFTRSKEVLEYIYSFLPSEVRKVVGCVSGKPYSFTSSTDLHTNLKLLYMVNSDFNKENIKEHYIDLKAKEITVSPQTQAEIDFLDSVDKWIRLPFEQREALITNLQGYLKNNKKQMEKLESYIGLFNLADPKSRWWEDFEKKYSIHELREKYQNDYIVQNHPEFKKQFINNISNLVEGNSLELQFDEFLRSARTVKELVAVNDDIQFYMNNFNYPNIDEKAVKKASLRVYGKSHGLAEWIFMKQSFGIGKKEEDLKFDKDSAPSKILQIYKNVDKRYDEEWVDNSDENLYLYLESIEDHQTLIDELLDAYCADKKTVNGWQNIKAHISDADMEAYITALLQSEAGAPQILQRTLTALDFAQDKEYKLGEALFEKAADLFVGASMFSTEASEAALAGRQKAASGYRKELYSKCAERTSAARSEKARKEEENAKLVSENEDYKAKFSDIEKNHQIALDREKEKAFALLTEKEQADKALKEAESQLAEHKESVQKLTTERDRAQRENQRIQASLTDKEQAIKTAQTEINSLRSEKETYSGKYAKLSNAYSHMERENEKLENECKHLERESERMKSELNRRTARPYGVSGGRQSAAFSWPVIIVCAIMILLLLCTAAASIYMVLTKNETTQSSAGTTPSVTAEPEAAPAPTPSLTIVPTPIAAEPTPTVVEPTPTMAEPTPSQTL